MTQPKKDSDKPDPSTEIIPLDVVKNKVIKDGPMEEKRSAIAPGQIRETSLGKGIALFCDNCYVREKCPEFKPAQSCVFTTDKATIESSADMVRVIKSLLGVQVERINQMRVVESLDGGYADGTLSIEMDRFFKMCQQLKDLSDTRDVVEIKAKGAGIISQLFGKPPASK